VTEAAPSPAGVTTTDLLNSGPSQPPPQPSFMPEGFPVAPPGFNEAAAVAARAKIEERKGDKEFYKLLVAERSRGVTGPASQEWAGLHAAGYPSPAAIESQADVDGQGRARNAEQWDSYIGNLKTRFPLTAEQEAEIRGGVVDVGVRQWTIEQKDRLVKDLAFYKRLMDGERAANDEWGRVTAILSLRPVKRA
jgi:hypothetical protein